MTPKEKCNELNDKFWNHELFEYVGIERAELHSKQCALIAVDEIIRAFKLAIPNSDKDSWHPCNWWEEVKTELDKL